VEVTGPSDDGSRTIDTDKCHSPRILRDLSGPKVPPFAGPRSGCSALSG
jgi:hypothetical protein